MSKSIEQLKSGKEFVRYVEHHPQAHDIRQAGSHVCVKGSKPGTAVIPNHNGDLPTGTRKSVVKMLLAIGLGVLVPMMMCNFQMVCFRAVI